MFVVTYRKFFYTFSTLLVVISIAAVSVWGLNLGIDFKGGSILEIEYPNGRPDQTELAKSIAPLSVDASIRPTGTDGYIIRMRSITQNEKTALSDVLFSLATSPAVATTTP